MTLAILPGRVAAEMLCGLLRDHGIVAGHRELGHGMGSQLLAVNDGQRVEVYVEATALEAARTVMAQLESDEGAAPAVDVRARRRVLLDAYEGFAPATLLADSPVLGAEDERALTRLDALRALRAALVDGDVELVDAVTGEALPAEQALAAIEWERTWSDRDTGQMVRLAITPRGEEAYAALLAG